MNDKELQKSLKFDALAEAEEITGKSYKTNPATMNWGLMSMFGNNQRKAAALEKLGDTRWGISIDEFEIKLRVEGFNCLLNVDFPSSDSDGDAFRIWHSPKTGILLKYDTFNGKTTINGGTFYYNWRPSLHSDDIWEFTSSGGMRDGVWIGNHDCREAMFFNIRRMAENGEFVTPWIERPSLWLLHYGDEKGSTPDARLELLPESTRKALGKEKSR